MTKYYSTSEVAEASRTTLRTIRFWESQGLFSAVERDRRGERQFTGAHLQRARVIAAASMAGMSLDAIKNSPPNVIRLNLTVASMFIKQVHDEMAGGFDL